MNRNSWTIIGITFAVCAIFAFFVTKNQVTSTYQLFHQISAADTNLSEISKKKEILDNLSKNDQLVNLYSIASKYIPTEPDSSQLVLELSAIATQNNLKVEQFSLDSKTAATAAPATSSATPAAPAPSTDTNSISEIPFTIKLTGSFPDYLSFLTGVQTSSRLVTITAMNLAQSDTAFSSQITGKAYYKKATGLDQSLANITISQDIINKFLNLKSFSTVTTAPADSGFGRSNPFAQ